ncbi:MAG: hypothetical protein J0M01_17085, partial [Dechloromonas sp.]|nr:hypothetical protein [Dechloromonas sp.]
LKRPGAWWRAANAEHMLALRLNRANRQWLAYWARQASHGVSQAACENTSVCIAPPASGFFSLGERSRYHIGFDCLVHSCDHRLPLADQGAPRLHPLARLRALFAACRAAAQCSSPCRRDGSLPGWPNDR